MKYILVMALMFCSVAFAQLSEQASISQVSISDSGHCQIRKSVKILKGEKMVSEAYHRWAIEPEGDLSFLDDELSKISVTDKNHAEFQADVKRVRAVCKAGWSPDVVKKYKDQKAKSDLLLKR